MLINSLYSEKQLTKEDIERYLKKIFILIRRNEVKRIDEKTVSDYKKTDERITETTWEHERDSIKLDEFNKKKRKYFKYEKVKYIRRFYRNKENLSKRKKDILVTFEELENENVLKRKKNQDEKL